MVKRNKPNDSNRKSRYRQPSTGEQIVPYAVLGLSVGALALSVYAVTGGPVDNYLASRQNNVVYAEEQQQTPVEETPDFREVLGEGEYDIKVQIDENGERSYVLTPIQSDEVDGDESSESDVDEQEVEDEKLADESETDNSEETDSESESTESDEDVAETDDENELSEEAQAELEEHKSMRLRIRPDRDGGDIYYYVVEPGDSLAMISEHFNVPLGQLMEDNYIENGDMIYVGEVIFMPTDFVQ